MDPTAIKRWRWYPSSIPALTGMLFEFRVQDYIVKAKFEKNTIC